MLLFSWIMGDRGDDVTRSISTGAGDESLAVVTQAALATGLGSAAAGPSRGRCGESSSAASIAPPPAAGSASSGRKGTSFLPARTGGGAGVNALAWFSLLRRR